MIPSVLFCCFQIRPLGIKTGQRLPVGTGRIRPLADSNWAPCNEVDPGLLSHLRRGVYAACTSPVAGGPCLAVAPAGRGRWCGLDPARGWLIIEACRCLPLGTNDLYPVGLHGLSSSPGLGPFLWELMVCLPDRPEHIQRPSIALARPGMASTDAAYILYSSTGMSHETQ